MHGRRYHFFTIFIISINGCLYDGATFHNILRQLLVLMGWNKHHLIIDSQPLKLVFYHRIMILCYNQTWSNLFSNCKEINFRPAASLLSLKDFVIGTRYEIELFKLQNFDPMLGSFLYISTYNQVSTKFTKYCSWNGTISCTIELSPCFTPITWDLQFSCV